MIEREIDRGVSWIVKLIQRNYDGMGETASPRFPLLSCNAHARNRRMEVWNRKKEQCGNNYSQPANPRVLHARVYLAILIRADRY